MSRKKETDQSFQEWDTHKGKYSRIATVRVNEFDQRNPAKLREFEKQFENLAVILSRNLGRYGHRRNVMERRTKRAGRINQSYVMGELVRAHAGRDLTDKIYDRKTNPDREHNKVGISMGLLLDQSGSTRFETDSGHTRIELIKYATLVIGRSIAEVNDGFFVYAFHAWGGDDGNPSIMERLKREDEPWSRTIEERIAAIEHTANGQWFNNKDGAAIRFANQEILKSPFDNRYLFMVTDGNPNCDYTHYRDSFAQEDTRKAMEEGNRAGIKYVYLTINPESDAERFMQRINPHTVFQRRFTKMKGLVPGLTEAYEMIKARRVA